MEYFDGKLSDLLTTEYGGEEVFGESVREIVRLFNVPSNTILFTTSDLDFEGVTAFTNYIFDNGIELIRVGSLGFYDKLIFKFIWEYSEGGLTTIFIPEWQKEYFEQFMSSLMI
jgi:hypothetical protein